MSSFELAIPVVLQNEGGLVDDPNDAGGLTKYGISQRSYPAVDIRNLTIAEASAIYLRDFWKFTGIVSQAVATKIFDTFVNEGHHAIKMAQTITGVTADGQYGANTEAAINAMDSTVFLVNYRAALVQYYQMLVAAKPSDSVFLNGWLARARQ